MKRVMNRGHGQELAKSSASVELPLYTPLCLVHPLLLTSSNCGPDLHLVEILLVIIIETVLRGEK